MRASTPPSKPRTRRSPEAASSLGLIRNWRLWCHQDSDTLAPGNVSVNDTPWHNSRRPRLLPSLVVVPGLDREVGPAWTRSPRPHGKARGRRDSSRERVPFDAGRPAYAAQTGGLGLRSDARCQPIRRRCLADREALQPCNSYAEVYAVPGSIEAGRSQNAHGPRSLNATGPARAITFVCSSTPNRRIPLPRLGS